MAYEWKVDQSDTRSNVKRVLPPSASVKLMERSSCGHLEWTKTPINQNFGCLIFNPNWDLWPSSESWEADGTSSKERKMATERSLKNAWSGWAEQQVAQIVKCLNQRLQLFSCSSVLTAGSAVWLVHFFSFLQRRQLRISMEKQYIYIYCVLSFVQMPVNEPANSAICGPQLLAPTS